MLGVSVLDSNSKAKFAKKYDLTFPLLADEDHAVIDKYGAWQEKSMYGKKYMGVARTTYLIGPDGKVVKRWDGVKVDGHAEDVLAAVQAALSIRGSHVSDCTSRDGLRRRSGADSPRARPARHRGPRLRPGRPARRRDLRADASPPPRFSRRLPAPG